MYTIKKTRHEALPALLRQPEFWQPAETTDISIYPWYRAGDKQKTRVRVLYGDTVLFLFFDCTDKHIFAQVIDLNGPVCGDSCVEFFATTEPRVKSHYFNIEINCCGAMLVGYGPHRHERIRITPALAARIQVVSSVPGRTKAESPLDNGWSIQAAVPFSVLQEFAGIRPPGPGTVWKVNMYRCGGRTDPQFAVWADIKIDKPDFHRPEFFQEMTFE